MASGVNYSLFKRIKPMLERFSKDTVIVSGGVARNKAIIHFIRNEMNFKEVIVPEKPQLNGALGCCALGRV
jgi:activator of 2-hydroxyglutaryl-CoA dehydratase